MKNKIKIEEIRKEKVFQVPEGYFHTLPVLIQNKIFEASTLHGRVTPSENIFLVPESYFEQLPKDIQAKIATLNSNILTEKKTTEVFQTPENYFDELSQKIQSKVSAEAHQSQPKLVWQWRMAYSLAGMLVLILMIYGGIRFWQQDTNQLVEQNTEEKLKEKPESEQLFSENKEILEEQETETQTQENITQPNPTNQTLIVDPESQESAQLAYQALKEVPKEAIDAYLQDSHHSDEEIIETLLETGQAAEMNSLADLLLESDSEDLLYQDISDQDLTDLDQLLDTKKNKKSEQ